MKALFTILVFLLLGSSLAFSQTAPPEQIANQRLAKAMDVIDQQDKYIAALEGKASALEASAKAKDDLILIITKQRDQALSIKCNQTRFFWGVISLKRCY